MEMKLGSRSGSQKGLVYSQRDRFRERPGPMLLKPLPGSNPDSAPVSIRSTLLRNWTYTLQSITTTIHFVGNPNRILFAVHSLE